MYSIRIRINHRLNEYCQGDTAHVGVRRRNGEITYRPWGGFTLDMVRPVKLVVESFTNEDEWNPRQPRSRMPQWTELKDDEYLLGSYSDGHVYTVLPFRIV